MTNGDALSAADIPAAAASRLWRRVTRGDGCWMLRMVRPSAIPRRSTCVNVAGRMVQARKVAYALERGPIPAGAILLQRCRAGAEECCVNPAHMELGTAADVSFTLRQNLDRDAVRRIRDLASSRTLAELADEFGRTREAISLVVRNVSHHDDSYTPPPVRRSAPVLQAARKLNDAAVAAAKAMHADGKSFKSIAAHYGVAKSTVIYAINGPRAPRPNRRQRP